MSDDNKPVTPKVMNLGEILEAADRAGPQIASWPSWKQQMGGGEVDPEAECTCPHSSAVTRQIQGLAMEAMSDVITGRGV